MTTSSTYDMLEIESIEIVDEQANTFKFNSKKYAISEIFSTPEVKSMIKILKEMKEKALKTNSKNTYDNHNRRKKKVLGQKVIDTFDLFDF